MYTRSYYTEDEKIAVPENYNGEAFVKEEAVAEPTEPVLKDVGGEPLRAPWDAPPPQSEGAFPKNDGILGGFLERITHAPIFRTQGCTEPFRLGTEEILIIGVALFLLFSKGGDRECAVMLLLLLLVK